MSGSSAQYGFRYQRVFTVYRTLKSLIDTKDPRSSEYIDGLTSIVVEVPIKDSLKEIDLKLVCPTPQYYEIKSGESSGSNSDLAKRVFHNAFEWFIKGSDLPSVFTIVVESEPHYQLLDALNEIDNVKKGEDPNELAAKLFLEDLNDERDFGFDNEELKSKAKSFARKIYYKTGLQKDDLEHVIKDMLSNALRICELNIDHGHTAQDLFNRLDKIVEDACCRGDQEIPIEDIFKEIVNAGVKNSLIRDKVEPSMREFEERKPEVRGRLQQIFPSIRDRPEASLDPTSRR